MRERRQVKKSNLIGRRQLGRDTVIRTNFSFKKKKQKRRGKRTRGTTKRVNHKRNQQRRMKVLLRAYFGAQERGCQKRKGRKIEQVL